MLNYHLLVRNDFADVIDTKDFHSFFELYKYIGIYREEDYKELMIDVYKIDTMDRIVHKDCGDEVRIREGYFSATIQ